MNKINNPWIYATLIASFALSGCNELSLNYSDEPEEEIEEPVEPIPDPEPEPEPVAPEAASMDFVPERTKTFSFVWTDVEGATSYRLLENPDGLSGFSQVGSDIEPGVEFASLSVDDVPLYERVNAEYMLESCNDIGCTASDPVYVDDIIGEAVGYIKSVNTSTGYYFGERVSLSGNGNTLVVSQVSDKSLSGGVGADFTDASGNYIGSIQIFEKVDGQWQFSEYITPEFPDGSDFFGQAIEVSEDGLQVFAASLYDDSGNPSDPSDGSAPDSGAVYVYEKVGSDWVHTQFLKANTIKDGTSFGSVIHLSADQNYLFIGMPSDNSSAAGINGNEADTTGNRHGSVSVLQKDTKGNWVHQAYIKPAAPFERAQFGSNLTANADGSLLAVSASFEDSLDSAHSRSGALYIFSRSGSTWTEVERLEPANVDSFDYFAQNLSFSADGSTLAASSQDDSASAGINGDETDNSLGGSGAIFIFEEADGSWIQTAFIKPDVPMMSGRFGAVFVRLNATGDRLYAAEEQNGADGNAFTVDNFSREKELSGAVYIFEKTAGTWTQERIIKASNAEAGDKFGSSGDVSTDEATLVFSSINENSRGTLLDADESDNNKLRSGAVYIF